MQWILLTAQTCYGERWTYLDDIQAGSTSSAHINSDGFDQRTLGKVLDLFGHSGAEEQGLSLSLEEEIKQVKQFLPKTHLLNSVFSVSGLVKHSKSIAVKTALHLKP